MDCKQKCIFGREYFESTPPIKISEGRQIGLHQTGWGILSDYYLESVKINSQKGGGYLSSATLNVGDRSGQTTCVVKGPIVGLLFDLSLSEWSNIEKLCGDRDQLFYRYFHKGLCKSYSCEQKMFYHFCLSNQTQKLLVAVFRRSVNLRNKDQNDALLYITDLRSCDNYILDLYLNYLREKKF